MFRVPSCPITGEPALRLVQWVSADLLAALWRIEFRVDARPSFRGVKRFGLWESTTGLYFFDPACAGDAGFYASFYGNGGMAGYLRDAGRGEFEHAARHVRPGERVLDVGCGVAAFRHKVAHAHYTGIDPHAAGPDAAAAGARAVTLADHLQDHAANYDVVCAFQVLEHVEAPLALLREMALAAKPGGKVIVGVPHVPSAPTRIPNWLTNAVPHHLTWWTPPALESAARRAGLVDPVVTAMPWSRSDGFVYWMARCSPVRCRDVHFRHDWAWHGAKLLGAIAGYIAGKVMPIPPPGCDEGVSLLLVAQRPASGV